MDDSAPPARDKTTERPGGPRLLRAQRSRLLLLHWPLSVAQLRPYVPKLFGLDTHKGRAWIGLVPSQVAGVRPAGTPSFPGLSSFLELNLRTYVVHENQPGIFHFSLDASSPVAVWLARKFFHLPYFRAEIATAEQDHIFTFRSRRDHRGARDADFACAWSRGKPLTQRQAGSWVEFLNERHMTFVLYRGRPYASPVAQQPWTLCEAHVHTLQCNVLEAAGLPTPEEPPLAHHCDELVTDVWPQREFSRSTEDAPFLDPALAPPPITFAR